MGDAPASTTDRCARKEGCAGESASPTPCRVENLFDAVHFNRGAAEGPHTIGHCQLLGPRVRTPPS
eukprot:8712542-Heterocapsa_arctica.AAC.1